MKGTTQIDNKSNGTYQTDNNINGTIRTDNKINGTTQTYNKIEGTTQTDNKIKDITQTGKIKDIDRMKQKVLNLPTKYIKTNGRRIFGYVYPSPSTCKRQ